MGLFIRADAQLFTGAMQAMAPLDASSGFLMCFRSFARHRADRDSGGARPGGVVVEEKEEIDANERLPRGQFNKLS